MSFRDTPPPPPPPCSTPTALEASRWFLEKGILLNPNETEAALFGTCVAEEARHASWNRRRRRDSCV